MGTVKKMPLGMRLKYATLILAGQYHQTNIYHNWGDKNPRRIELTSHFHMTRVRRSS